MTKQLKDAERSADADAWKCDRCDGDGWHWTEEEGCEPRDKVVAKAHCEQCDGLSWCGPDALAAANQVNGEAK